MKTQMTFQRICALCGIICPLLFFAALLVAGFLPPMAPGMSATDVVAHYQDNAAGVRLGAGLMLISSMFYVGYTAVMSGQMRRIPGIHQTVLNAQLAAGAFNCVTFLLPAMLFAVTAFRPDRSPESTLLFNDLSWIVLVIPWPPIMAQYFSFAFAILSDPRSEPLFPRWLGYVNIWAPITFTPAVILPFFKYGPFAWNGIFVFWVPAVAFGVVFAANVTCLLKAVNDEARQDAEHPGLAEAAA
jgi:hypothetical protein